MQKRWLMSMLVILLLAMPTFAWLKPGVVRAERDPPEEAALIMEMPTLTGMYQAYTDGEFVWEYLDGEQVGYCGFSNWWGDWSY